MTTTMNATTGTARSTWTIDPAHTHVGFAVRHMMIATVKGRFAAVAGHVELADDDLARSVVQVEIDAASIDTGNEQRDGHLRSGDFLDVEHHPRITFESRRIDSRPDGRLALGGDLTIRGVTREVVLEVAEEGRGTDPWGGERIGFTASGRIDRRAFGLAWNQALEAGGVLVGDEIRLSIDTQLVRVS